MKQFILCLKLVRYPEACLKLVHHCSETGVEQIVSGSLFCWNIDLQTGDLSRMHNGQGQSGIANGSMDGC